MRIFVTPAELVAGELAVRGDEHHYLTRVRRVRVGDAVELVDGCGRRAAATIARIDAQATTVVAVPAADIEPVPPRLRALIPLIKGDRMDVCLEKLVEVGVDEIVVWPAARAVVKLDGERLAGRIAKYREMVRAAARQSGRARVPGVSAAEALAAAAAGDGLRLVLDPASETPLAAALGASPTELTLITGPEGGFSPGEREQLAAAGFVGIGLGPRVLRAETAPVVAVAVIRALTAS
ncbi:MAG TPA: RsmE family RNA methyltransferase [Kofleriaceae bacterium]